MLEIYKMMGYGIYGTFCTGCLLLQIVGYELFLKSFLQSEVIELAQILDSFLHLKRELKLLFHTCVTLMWLKVIYQLCTC
jgi:hypothetical protein